MNQVLKICDQVGGGRKLSMSEAEASIEKFISCRWLKLVEEGCLTVDVRWYPCILFGVE